MLPENKTENLLILARSNGGPRQEAEFIRDKKHKKICVKIFFIWNELDPQQRLRNVAKTMVEVLDINGCGIYRRQKRSRVGCGAM